MAAVDSVEIKSSVGVDGNSYTTAVSNDKLTNDDFLRLLLEEMKMQDPTKPMDSQKMMDSQLQMSTIEANVNMSKSMAALQASYANTALSTATAMIGNIIEDGSIGEDGIQKSFKVETIENKDGKTFVNAKQLIGLIDKLALITEDGSSIAKYDNDGFIYEDGSKTNIRVKLDDDGRFTLDENNNITLLDEDGNKITDEDIIAKYKYNGTLVDYATTLTSIDMSKIIKVR
jgi:flagellar basal-body rod modification protein FlgD